VERWFGIITQRAIRRGSFSSVQAAGFRVAVGADRKKIEQFVVAYNKTKAQFSWAASAGSILEKLQRLCL
jgi:putative transposase